MNLKPSIATTITFALLLAAGLFCIDHVGISWDEPAMREYGLVLYDYVNGVDDELLTHHERYHGPFFELALVYMEKGLGLSVPSEIYHMRHVATFVVCIIGLWFFYLLNVNLFKNRWLGLLAILLLATSPRIFSHMLYNSKDTVFMMLCVASIWCLMKAYEKRSTNLFLIQGILVAVAITVRVLGVFLPAITGFALLFMPVALTRKLKIGGAYGLVVLFGVIAFWPVMWPSPFEQLIASFEHMRQFPWDDHSFFEGQFATPAEMPWYQIPKWIIMTTPLLQLVLMVVGPFFWLFFRKRGVFKWAILLWATAPLIAIIGLNATVYDTWRHVYFIYPAWIILAVGVIHSLYQMSDSKKALNMTLAVLGFALSTNIIWSIGNYRNLHCYFNPIFKTDAALKYDYDFWGLSYLEALEWTMNQKPSGTIRLSVANAPGYYNHLMLPSIDEQRIEFVSRDSADYFLSNFRFPAHFEPYQNGDYPYQNLVHEIMVDGNRAIGVYQPNN